MYDTLDDIACLIDERHCDIWYNGGFADDEDPFDYVNTKEVIRHATEILTD